MDGTGLLAAVLALGVYPGGAALAALAWAAARSAGRRADPSVPGWSHGALLAAGAAVIAAALLPLPGSPLGNLPAEGGPGANLFAVVLLLAAGAGALPGGIWPGRGRLAAGLAAAALVAVAARPGSHALEVVATLPGTAQGLARGAAGAALVGVGLLLARGRRRPEDELGRTALVTVCNLTGALLILQAPLVRLPGVVVCAAILAAALLGATACLRFGSRLPESAPELATGLAAALSLLAALVPGP